MVPLFDQDTETVEEIARDLISLFSVHSGLLCSWNWCVYVCVSGKVLLNINIRHLGSKADFQGIYQWSDNMTLNPVIIPKCPQTLPSLSYRHSHLPNTVQRVWHLKCVYADIHPCKLVSMNVYVNICACVFVCVLAALGGIFTCASLGGLAVHYKSCCFAIGLSAFCKPDVTSIMA